MKNIKSKQYWLMKSEGGCYSIDDLKNDEVVAWEGVRNYQARNFMMKDMHVGDTVFFYHSNGTKDAPTGIYGIAKVSSLPHPDKTQFDKKDEHYDPKSKKESPLWHCVDVAYVKKFDTPVTLAEIKSDPCLRGIAVAQKGSRLSVLPVSAAHGEYLLKIAK